MRCANVQRGTSTLSSAPASATTPGRASSHLHPWYVAPGARAERAGAASRLTVGATAPPRLRGRDARERSAAVRVFSSRSQLASDVRAVRSPADLVVSPCVAPSPSRRPGTARLVPPCEVPPTMRVSIVVLAIVALLAVGGATAQESQSTPADKQPEAPRVPSVTSELSGVAC
jgi:hypothetical protein